MTPDRRAAWIRTAAGVLYGTGAIRLGSWLAGYAGRQPAFPILTYHRVNDDADDFLPAVPASVFERHMAYVATAYRVMPLAEMVERAQKGSLPRNSLAITFDDGYRDNLTHAAPILHRLGLPATIFLATGLIGTGMSSWFDRLSVALKLTRVESVRTPWEETFILRDQAARLAALDRALGYLKTLRDDELQRVLDRFLEALGVPDAMASKNLMLDWDDVRALRGLGFDVGGHTVSHVILSRVSDERAWAEIRGSSEAIEASLGTKPTAFAYPNGRPEDYTRSTIDLVRRAGFAWAVTTRFGLNTRETPAYELRRGGPWESDVPTFALKLAAYRATHN